MSSAIRRIANKCTSSYSHRRRASEELRKEYSIRFDELREENEKRVNWIQETQKDRQSQMQHNGNPSHVTVTTATPKCSCQTCRCQPPPSYDDVYRVVHQDGRRAHEADAIKSDRWVSAYRSLPNHSFNICLFLCFCDDEGSSFHIYLVSLQFYTHVISFVTEALLSCQRW